MLVISLKGLLLGLPFFPLSISISQLLCPSHEILLLTLCVRVLTYVSVCVSTALAVDVRDLAIHKEDAILKPR